MNHFRLKVAELPPIDSVTKRFLISDVAKTFDILGWFSPCTINEDPLSIAMGDESELG